MTAVTFCKREGHTAMASPTIFPIGDFDHGDGVCAFFHNKDAGVAIGAIQPVGVRKVGENYIRHSPDRWDINVKIEGSAWGFFQIQRLMGFDNCCIFVHGIEGVTTRATHPGCFNPIGKV